MTRLHTVAAIAAGACLASLPWAIAWRHAVRAIDARVEAARVAEYTHVLGAMRNECTDRLQLCRRGSPADCDVKGLELGRAIRPPWSRAIDDDSAP